MKLVVERRDDAGEWVPVGELRAGAPSGSLSNNAEGRRDVIRFTCHGSFSLIERSVGGMDAELGERRDLREIRTLGFEPLARLESGEAYYLQVQTDRMKSPRALRFRHVTPTE